VESTSFQPDPSMIGALLASLYAVMRHHESAQRSWLLAAAALSALAVLFKPVAIFFTLGAFAALAVSRGGWRQLPSRETAIFAVASVAPTALFYLWVMSRSALGEHSAFGFAPHLLLEQQFYAGWLGMIHKTSGLSALVAGLAGLLVVPSGHRRNFLLGLWIAYGAYGLVKTYHIYTHPYYQLPLLPIVALSLGATLAITTTWLAGRSPTSLARHCGAAIAALPLLFSFGLVLQRYRAMPDFSAEVRAAETIGRDIRHSTRTILLARFSGRPLRYHGHFCGQYWPDAGEIAAESAVGLPVSSTEQRLDALIKAGQAQYFIVRDLEELERQNDLQQLLRARYPVLIESPEYIIFDLRPSPAPVMPVG
jgi:hypothetical protein